MYERGRRAGEKPAKSNSNATPHAWRAYAGAQRQTVAMGYKKGFSMVECKNEIVTE